MKYNLMDFLYENDCLMYSQQLKQKALSNFNWKGLWFMF
jgi:hypothetical protein